MITSEPFRDVAQRNGLDFVATLSTDDYNAMTHHPDLWDPKKGLRVILNPELMRKHLPIVFHAIRERYEPGQTVAVGGSLAYAAQDCQRGAGHPLCNRPPSADVVL